MYGIKDIKNSIIYGDCIKVMGEMPKDSIDTIIADPPYGLGFMGKDWDIKKNYQQWTTKWAKEALRVAKPGATLLAFGGTRTWHRLACGLENAGWVIKDTLMYLYGQGFPKSLNIAKNIRKQIGKWKERIYTDYSKEIVLWKKRLNNANIAEKIFSKNPTEVGDNIIKNDFVVVNVILITNEKILHLLDVIIAESGLKEVNHLLRENIIIAHENVEMKQKQKLLNANGAEKSLEVQSQTNQNFVLKNATIYQCEKIKDKIKGEEVQKIERGKMLLSKETVINVNYAEVVKILKHIILSQSKTFQRLDTKLQMGLLTAINAIITKSTMECLITKMVNMWDKREKEWKGYGTALKPAYEPIIMAMKPNEGSYADNALKHGVAGLNIDSGRIETKPRKTGTKPTSNKPTGTRNTLLGSSKKRQAEYDKQNKGRFPANVIISEEVAPLIDEQSGDRISGGGQKGKMGGIFGNKKENPFRENSLYYDKGGASRFFYVAKASKAERNIGCEGLEKKHKRRDDGQPYGMNTNKFRPNGTEREEVKPQTNSHPTVKPLKLLEYLVKLTSMLNKDQIYLDPFAGSGTTGIACEKIGRNYILIEKELEYCEIAKARIKAAQKQLRFNFQNKGGENDGVKI